MVKVVNQKYHNPTVSCTIYIGRGSPVGDPYPVDKYGRDKCIELFEKEFRKCLNTKADTEHFIYKDVQSYMNRIWWTNRVEGIVYLACFCKPLRCHGDVIKAIIESVGEGK